VAAGGGEDGLDVSFALTAFPVGGEDRGCFMDQQGVLAQVLRDVTKCHETGDWNAVGDVIE